MTQIGQGQNPRAVDVSACGDYSIWQHEEELKGVIIEKIPDPFEFTPTPLNLLINVIYSGTVAAAIEAAFLGLPAVAASLYLRPGEVPTDYARAAKLARQTIEQILHAKLLQPGIVANINIPALQPHQEPAGTRVVRQCCRPYIDTYEQRLSPKGQTYFWNSSVFSLGASDEGTDTAALRDGYITVTPLQFDLTDHAAMGEWKL